MAIGRTRRAKRSTLNPADAARLLSRSAIPPRKLIERREKAESRNLPVSQYETMSQKVLDTEKAI
jgi:hypothetical protein